MAKILYRAYDSYGNIKDGYIEAVSNKDAIDKLRKIGYEQIYLYSDALYDYDRDDLEGLNEKELEQIAKVQIDRMINKKGFGNYVWESLKSDYISILIGIVLLYFGYRNSSYITMSIGVIIASFGPFMKIWNYKLISVREKIQYAFALGKWKEVFELADRLKNLADKRKIIFDGRVNDDLKIEADGYKAYYYAKKGDINQAIKIMKRHRDHMDNILPGMFESKIASLCFAQKDYKSALHFYKKAYEINDNDIFKLDLASCEARFGSLENAKTIIESIDEKSIPVYAKGMIYYIYGVIHQKEDNLEQAYISFMSAYEAFVAFRHIPMMLGFIAMATASLAITLAKNNQTQEAQEFFDDEIIQVIKIHADEYTLTELKKYFSHIF